MSLAVLTRFAATLEIRWQRAMMTALAGVFLFAALIFALSATWLWLAAALGAIAANLICAVFLGSIGGVILLVGRPRKPVSHSGAPAAGAPLSKELIAAFSAGSQIGRSMRR